MAMEPEARIAPPEGNGEPLENMSGGRERVHGAGSLSNCPTDGKKWHPQLAPPVSRPLWGCIPLQPHGKQGGWR